MRGRAFGGLLLALLSYISGAGVRSDSKDQYFIPNAGQCADDSMTKLQFVSVEGFKGVDSLEFEPGAINVITGRNNSGKTSLLEAIDLGLQPSNIERFGPNLDKVVNFEYEQAKMEIGNGSETVTFQLSTPDRRRMYAYILNIFQDLLIDFYDGFFEDEAIRKDLLGVMNNEFPAIFGRHITIELLDEAKKEVLVIERNETEYPHIYFGPMMLELLNSFQNLILKEAGSEEYEVDNINFRGTTPFVTHGNKLRKIDEKVEFAKDHPPNICESSLIDFQQVSNAMELTEEDADPVKIDDIGDFIKENEIVDDLKTFGLDHLIFEDEHGEKQSVPFDFMGEGFKAIVGLLWHLLGDDGPADVILLEEPETHMHPGYVRELIYFLVDLAKDEDVQFFITTHNNDFLNDFFTENIQARDGEFLEEEFRLVQMHDGTADVMTYDEAETDLKDLHLDLRGI